MDDERTEPVAQPGQPGQPGQPEPDADQLEPGLPPSPPPPEPLLPPPPPPPPAWSAAPAPPVVGWAMPADVARPSLDVGSIIGRSFDTFGREWSLFLVLAAPAAVGVLLQTLLVPGGLGGMGSGSGLGTAGTLATRPRLDDIPAYLAASLLSALLGLVSTVAIAVAADDLWQGRAVGVTDAMARGLLVLPKYLVVSIVIGLMVGAIVLIGLLVVVAAFTVLGPAGVFLGVLGVLAGLPAAIYVSARISLLAPVVVLERNGILASIVRAWDLSRGHVIMLFALTIAIGICAGIPLWGATLFATFVPSPAIAGVALAIATLVFEPLPAIAIVLAWGDRTGGRHRDSEVMARGRGRRTAALLVFGLGAILLVAGLGVAAQAASTAESLR